MHKRKKKKSGVAKVNSHRSRGEAQLMAEIYSEYTEAELEIITTALQKREMDLLIENLERNMPDFSELQKDWQ